MAGSAVPRPATHVRPAEGEANELLGFERVMWVMRIVGFAVAASQAPLYRLVHPGLLAAALAIVGATIVVQPRLLPEGMTHDPLRRRALALLAADLVAVYLLGTAFAADPDWLGFYFYPPLALEATLVAGPAGGVGVTVLSLLVYLAQVAGRATLGFGIDPRAVTGAAAMLVMTGGFMAAFGAAAERGRRDLRVLLDLTSALAHQQAETQTIELLDRRLADAVGGRVRSVALRQPDGSYEILRWHSDSRRMLTREALDRALGDVDALSARFAAGGSVTYASEPGSPVGPALGLPDWARAVTLVPVFVEGRWIGILPVLWQAATVPSRHQLRLLYGLANQVGLALAQGQLQRVRHEAATDPLTGLLNRRAILGELDGFVARASRSGGRVAVLFCDLDGFKAVNDRGGHEAGDRVLRAVAASVRGAMRQGDVLGRLGGDELLVVAADASAADASALAARIRSAVRAAAGGENVDVTIGIATYPDDAPTGSDLVATADRAMYRGKLLGPGSVVVGSSRTDDPVTTSA
jgi:diguanylate cyclase (GGDEF)-like protein